MQQMQWTVAAKAAVEKAQMETHAKVLDAAIALAETSAAIGHEGAVDRYTFERALCHARFEQAGENWLARQETAPEAAADSHQHTWRALRGYYEAVDDAKYPGTVTTWYRARCTICGLTWEYS